MAVRIICIKKANGDHENPYVAISSMNWINEGIRETGSSTREQMYDFVVKSGEAYVNDAAGNKARLVGMVSPKGTRYVKTVADDVKSDNLLKLEECE